jgi:tRNA/tmRNA/rRNA uracil-C5-methylase (TrmA/RlmC/RlmD family)
MSKCPEGLSRTEQLDWAKSERYRSRYVVYSKRSTPEGRSYEVVYSSHHSQPAAEDAKRELIRSALDRKADFRIWWPIASAPTDRYRLKGNVFGGRVERTS